MNDRILSSTAWGLLLSVLLAACGGGSGGGTTPATQNDTGSLSTTLPPTGLGTSVGEAASAVLGVKGGSIQSPDNVLTVTFPENVLAPDTTVTVQPLTNPAHGGSGSAYRITPEGSTFATPVTLTFQYTDEEVSALDQNEQTVAVPELLDIHTQDEQGYWSPVGNVQIDKDKHTISVETNHFSTFAKLFKFKYTKNLVAKTNSTHSLLYFPVSTSEYKVKSVGPAWRVEDILGGNSTYGFATPFLDTSFFVAKYQAPKVVPKKNPVSVATLATFERTTGGKEQVHGIVSTTIQIVDEISVYKGYVYASGIRDDSATNGMTYEWTIRPTEVTAIATYKEAGNFTNYSISGLAVLTVKHKLNPNEPCEPLTRPIKLTGGLTVFEPNSGLPTAGQYSLNIASSETVIANTTCGNSSGPPSIPVQMHIPWTGTGCPLGRMHYSGDGTQIYGRIGFPCYHGQEVPGAESTSGWSLTAEPS